MKSASSGRPSIFASSEKNSRQLLIDKMGLSKKEFQEITAAYGVSASKLLEIMQLSKYQFVYSGKVPGQCEVCYHLGKI